MPGRHLREQSQSHQFDDDRRERDMFSHDADLLLTLHRTHAAELRAEADQDRLARSLPHRPPRGWLHRRHHRAGTGDARH